jgi:hypothetical protein
MTATCARWPDSRCRQPGAICRWGCSGRQDVQAVIDHEGAFVVSGDLAAFVCR